MSEKEQLLQEYKELTQQIINIHRRQEQIRDRLLEIDMEDMYKEDLYKKQEEVLSTFAT